MSLKVSTSGVKHIIAGSGVAIDDTDPKNPIISTTGGGGGTWGSITGTLSDQTDLQAALDTKVDKNTAITGATKTKITYDAKGLVTAGADATTADIADSSNKRYVTDAQLTVIGNTSGTNTGDQTNVTGNAGTVTTINGKITAGTNITITGSGSSASPYNISASGGSDTAPTHLTADTTLTSADKGKIFTNKGATGAVIVTLPTAVAGFLVTFFVFAAFDFQIQAASGDYIRDAGLLSVVAGNTKSNKVGSVLKIYAVDDTYYFVESAKGSWSIT